MLIMGHRFGECQNYGLASWNVSPKHSHIPFTYCYRYFLVNCFVFAVPLSFWVFISTLCISACSCHRLSLKVLWTNIQIFVVHLLLSRTNPVLKPLCLGMWTCTWRPSILIRSNLMYSQSFSYLVFLNLLSTWPAKCWIFFYLPLKQATKCWTEFLNSLKQYVNKNIVIDLEYVDNAIGC